MKENSTRGETVKSRADLLVLGGRVLTMDEERRIFNPGAIAVRGCDIVAVGTVGDVLREWDADRSLDVPGCVVMPGLVNAHTHAAMSLFRGFADDLPLLEWLKDRIFKVEWQMKEDWAYWGSLLACAEMILSGTTCFCDMYLFEHMTARAAQLAGMRALLGEGLFDFPSPHYGPVENGLHCAEALIDEWSGDPLIRAAVTPHSLYTCSPDLLVRAGELAGRRGVPLVIHLSETAEEVGIVTRAYGCRPVVHLDSLGLLGPRLIAPHCVELDDHDMDLLALRDVQVVHNPECNMKLASGIAPVPRLLSMGINVALGTDGCASNNNLDMFGEMSTCARLHKVSGMDPTLVPAGAVLEMATRNGARALGLTGVCGELSVGSKADFIVVDFESPHLSPVYSSRSHLVYAAMGSDVRDSFVHGRQVMANRELLTIDIDEVFAHVCEIADIVRS